MQCASKRYKVKFLKNIKILDLIMTLCCRIDVLASSSFYYFITFLKKYQFITTVYTKM